MIPHAFPRLFQNKLWKYSRCNMWKTPQMKWLSDRLLEINFFSLLEPVLSTEIHHGISIYLNVLVFINLKLKSLVVNLSHWEYPGYF